MLAPFRVVCPRCGKQVVDVAAWPWFCPFCHDYVRSSDYKRKRAAERAARAAKPKYHHQPPVSIETQRRWKWLPWLGKAMAAAWGRRKG